MLTFDLASMKLDFLNTRVFSTLRNPEPVVLREKSSPPPAPLRFIPSPVPPSCSIHGAAGARSFAEWGASAVQEGLHRLPRRRREHTATCERPIPPPLLSRHALSS